MNPHFDSVILSLIYTLGHVIIAGVTVYVLTGSTIWEAGLVALVVTGGIMIYNDNTE